MIDFVCVCVCIHIDWSERHCSPSLVCQCVFVVLPFVQQRAALLQDRPAFYKFFIFFLARFNLIFMPVAVSNCTCYAALSFN